MRFSLRTVLLILLVALTALLGSCSIASVSIADRISMFVSSLNTDRSTTSQNLDPATVAPTPTQWNSFFGTQYEPYAFSPNPPNNTSDPNNVQTNIIGSGSSGWNFAYKFVMVNVGTGSDDWRIHSLYITNGSGGWNPVF